MNFYTVDILTPNKVLARDIPAESLLIPTVRGEINVLPEHTHIIAKLDTGILTIFGGANDPDRYFSITTGVCKVLDKKIQILSNVSEESTVVDAERAKKAIKNAQDKLDGSDSLNDYEIEKYRRKIERAQIRIQLAKKS